MKSYDQIQDELDNLLEKDEGFQVLKLNLETLTIDCTYDCQKTGPRQVIDALDKLEYSAMLKTKDDSMDIRKLAKSEVQAYKKKLLLCFILYFPILFLIWIVPYFDSLKMFMMSFHIWNGNTLYVILILIAATII